MKFLVNTFVPRIYELLKKENLVKDADKGSPDIGLSMVLVHKDKCFKVCSDLTVWEVSDYFAIGAGEDPAYISIRMTENYKNVQTRLVQAMRLAGKFVTSVGAPFTLIDNKDYIFTVKEA